MRMKKIVTCEQKHEFWKEQELTVYEQPGEMQVVSIYPQVTYQTIDGFGGAFTEASAHTYMGCSDAKKKEMIEAYFGKDGLRYNIGRIHMNSCDFALGNYTYIEDWDAELKTFSIAHDEKEILPFLTDAIEKRKETYGEDLTFLVSPWSPPAFMKTNGEMNHGGKLKKEYYATWAAYFVKFIQAYRAKGINIRALTVQNEPAAVQTWDSCVYTAEEEAEFVGNYLGEALEKAGLSDVDIFVWDHNKEILFERFGTCIQNEKAAKYIKGAAVHWYTGDHFEAIEMVQKQYPGTKVIFSEGCVEYSRFADTKETAKAEMYAHDMIGNFRAGLSAYFDWNLILDMEGGPNHVGNFCAAPILCDPKNDTFDKRLAYYYIGQFSRYIKKEAVRIATTRYTDALDVCGFLNPDGSRVIVVLNKGDKPVDMTLREDGMGVKETVEAHSIATYILEE